MAGKKGRSGGARPGSGRPVGSKNKRTCQLIERVEHEELTDVVVLLTRWANDENEPKPFRAACAGKAAEFTHAKPARGLDRIPLLREMTDWQLEDWERHLAEDMARDPDYYDLPHPRPQLVSGMPPDRDYHEGGAGRWWAGVRAEVVKRLEAVRREPGRRRRLQAMLQRIDLMTPADDDSHPNARDWLMAELDQMAERMRAGRPPDLPDAS
jgi:hypothetical protein